MGNRPRVPHDEDIGVDISREMLLHCQLNTWCNQPLLVHNAWRLFSNMSDKKRIQISSNLQRDGESFHEKIQDHNTGETKIIDQDEPHSTTVSTTVTSNPTTVETNGPESKTKQGESRTVDENPALEGLDTSQL